MVTDGGEYTCLAISESGDASASAFLTIIGLMKYTITKIKTLLYNSIGYYNSKPVTCYSYMHVYNTNLPNLYTVIISMKVTSQFYQC